MKRVETVAGDIDWMWMMHVEMISRGLQPGAPDSGKPGILADGRAVKRTDQRSYSPLERASAL